MKEKSSEVALSHRCQLAPSYAKKKRAVSHEGPPPTGSNGVLVPWSTAATSPHLYRKHSGESDRAATSISELLNQPTFLLFHTYISTGSMDRG